MSFNEGQEILDGRFKIQKKLGSGAFGEIYKVEKKKTGESFAAKIVSTTTSNPIFLQEKA
jgi:serine/threonine protein kinase